MTDNVVTTDDILLRYVNYLLEGFTLQLIMIKTSTFKGYMRAVNNYYYKHHRLTHSWELKSKSKAVELLNQQIIFEEKADKSEHLYDKVLAQLMRLADEGHALSFRKAIWLWTKLGRYTGFRCQEFAMESRSVLQVYVKPNGTHVVRAFMMKHFIWFNDDGMIVALEEVL